MKLRSLVNVYLFSISKMLIKTPFLIFINLFCFSQIQRSFSLLHEANSSEVYEIILHSKDSKQLFLDRFERNAIPIYFVFQSAVTELYNVNCCTVFQTNHPAHLHTPASCTDHISTWSMVCLLAVTLDCLTCVTMVCVLWSVFSP